jgi:hypothetical protein
LFAGHRFCGINCRSRKDDTENNSLSLEDHFVFILDLESLLNKNSRNYNETGYNMASNQA